MSAVAISFEASQNAWLMLAGSLGDGRFYAPAKQTRGSICQKVVHQNVCGFRGFQPDDRYSIYEYGIVRMNFENVGSSFDCLPDEYFHARLGRPLS